MKHPWTWLRDECTHAYHDEWTWATIPPMMCAGLVMVLLGWALFYVAVGLYVLYLVVLTRFHVNLGAIVVGLFFFAFVSMIGTAMLKRRVK